MGNLTASLTQLGPIWDHLGPTWGDLEPTWDQLGRILGQLVANLAQLDPTWRQHDVNLEPNYPPLGSPWPILGYIWSTRGSIHRYVHTLQSMLYSACVPRSILHSPYLHSTSNSLAQANTATAIPAAIIARCPLRIDHCILPIAHCLLHQPAAHNLLPIASFFRLGPAECAERLNPPPLPLGKSWRVRSTTEVHILEFKSADL